MNGKYLSAIILSGVLVVPTFANAACTQADLTGTWQAYLLRYNGPFDSWAQCKMVIKSTGAITNTTCRIMPVDNHALTAGSLKMTVAQSCGFTGTFKINNVLHTVQVATVGKDKSYAAGVGQTTQQSLIFHMIKL